MATIRNATQLYNWLDGKPAAFAQALTVRIALRILPFTASRDVRSDLCLVVFRAISIAWAARVCPAQDMRAAAAAADAAAADAAAAYAARSAAAAAAYAVAVLWSAISNDTNWLARKSKSDITAQTLACQALWPEGVPEIFAHAWVQMEANLTQLRQDWPVWIDWYERRLSGDDSGFGLPSGIDEKFTVELALESNEFWKREAAIVNEEIKSRLEAARPIEPLPGVYGYNFSNGIIAASPVPRGKPADQAFADQLLAGLRAVASIALSQVQGLQGDSALSALLDEIVNALSKSYKDIPVGSLEVFQGVLAKMAAIYNDPRRENPSPICGILDGLVAELEKFQSLSEAVVDARASAAILQMTEGNETVVNVLLDRIVALARESKAVDASVVQALSEGAEHLTQIDELQRRPDIQPEAVQKAVAANLRIQKQRMVSTFGLGAFVDGKLKEVKAAAWKGVLGGVEAITKSAVVGGATLALTVLGHEIGLAMSPAVEAFPFLAGLQTSLIRQTTDGEKDKDKDDD